MLVCLFDIDGTLISSGGAGQAALEAALASSFKRTPDLLGVSLAGRTDRDITRDLFQAHGIADTPENWSQFRAAYLGHLPQMLRTRSGRILPGVVDLLDRLTSRQHVAIGLLTGNIRQGADHKLGHYGLSQYFAFGGFGDLHHDRDCVAHEALASARSHLALEPNLDRVWVIGDTPRDVRCARAIGARAVAVATGSYPTMDLVQASPDIVLPDLSEITLLTEAWNI
jgi:phosphoglycolate phosphatase-like HAD superfamily hydrolase